MNNSRSCLDPEIVIRWVERTMKRVVFLSEAGRGERSKLVGGELGRLVGENGEG